MFKFVVLSALVAGASAGYASSQYAGAGTSSGLYNQVNSNFDSSAYADKFPYTNTGYNGGFTSNYAGPNGVGAAAGTGAFTPGFAAFQAAPVFPNVFDFNGFYQGLQANFANLYQQQLAHQNALFNSFRQQQAAFAANVPNQGNYAGAGNYAGNNGGGSYGGNRGGTYGGAGNYAGNNGGGSYGGAGFAGASASYGPGGFHQTAQIYPQNPASPNIDTRFGGDSQQGGPGFVGVSSFSSSSNINGQTHREASTSVNDNGKVTTYHVRS